MYINVCSYKDGKFFPCDNFDPKSSGNTGVYCFACKTNIERSEEIIVPSGNTFLGRDAEGIDYIWTRSYFPWNTIEKACIKGKSTGKVLGGWEKILNVVIDDKLALLRPLVVRQGRALERLYGVNSGMVILYDAVMLKKYVRLARVEDII